MNNEKIVLIKNVSRLRATYQIRLLAFLAKDSRRKLFLYLPKHGIVDATLEQLIALVPGTIEIARFK